MSCLFKLEGESRNFWFPLVVRMHVANCESSRIVNTSQTIIKLFIFSTFPSE